MENGCCPFLDGLKNLSVSDQAKVLDWARRLAWEEQLRRPPFARSLGEEIFELRLFIRAAEHRWFFFYAKEDKPVLTHCH
jgi:hypothetical protein